MLYILTFGMPFFLLFPSVQPLYGQQPERLVGQYLTYQSDSDSGAALQLKYNRQYTYTTFGHVGHIEIEGSYITKGDTLMLFPFEPGTDKPRQTNFTLSPSMVLLKRTNTDGQSTLFDIKNGKEYAKLRHTLNK
jgi:hypothetical protein